jgi:hypothetical protein
MDTNEVCIAFTLHRLIWAQKPTSDFGQSWLDFQTRWRERNGAGAFEKLVATVMADTKPTKPKAKRVARHKVIQ